MRRMPGRMSVLLLASIAAGAPTAACPLPPLSWTKSSANGGLELIRVSLTEEPRSDPWSPPATYRLERVGPSRELVWEARANDFHFAGLVANDGDYVVTWGSGDDITLRNSAGAVIRSVAPDEIVSLAEQVEGATWTVRGLDESQEYLLVDVVLADESLEGRVSSRRIQLMDGEVIDAPHTPPGFELPELSCPASTTLRVAAYWHGVSLRCLDASGAISLWRDYELHESGFELIEAVDMRGGGVLRWSAQGSEDEPGPCERSYRDDELVSQRCGADVAAPR